VAVEKELSEIARIIVQLAPDTALDEKERNEAIVAAVASSIQADFGHPRVPEGAKTVAVTDDLPKTAALFFDCVAALPVNFKAPDEVAAFGGTTFEAAWLGLYRHFRGASADTLLAMRRALARSEIGRTLLTDALPARMLADAFIRERNLNATPVYAQAQMRDAEYKAGNYEVIVGILRDVAVPDEQVLSWEQVLDFRRDRESRRRYRRFVHWLDREMVGKSTTYIADELAVRLNDYELSLRKHGIATVIGTIESVIDPKFVAAASVLTTGLGLGLGGAAGAASAVTLFGAKAACTVARGLLDLHELKRKSSDIAFVHELKTVAAGAG